VAPSLPRPGSSGGTPRLFSPAAEASSA
jgi:hypothetical protein